MADQLVKVRIEGAIAAVALNDPAKRNALSLAMFDGLDAALERVRSNDSIHVVLLCGEGSVFCAGFDLAAAVADPDLMPQFIYRLSGVLRTLRRMPQVVVAAVQGAAIAGGCALLSACDFVVIAAEAKLGYPVHRIGVSPAVTIPTLHQAVGGGASRALLMGGELIGGVVAHRLGLATHIAPSDDRVLTEAQALCAALATKGPNALRATKAWLNQLDGSLNDANFDGPARGSAAIAELDEARTMLSSWANRR